MSISLYLYIREKKWMVQLLICSIYLPLVQWKTLLSPMTDGAVIVCANMVDTLHVRITIIQVSPCSLFSASENCSTGNNWQTIFFNPYKWFALVYVQCQIKAVEIPGLWYCMLRVSGRVFVTFGHKVKYLVI